MKANVIATAKPHPSKPIVPFTCPLHKGTPVHLSITDYKSHHRPSRPTQKACKVAGQPSRTEPISYPSLEPPPYQTDPSTRLPSLIPLLRDPKPPSVLYSGSNTCTPLKGGISRGTPRKRTGTKRYRTLRIRVSTGTNRKSFNKAPWNLYTQDSSRDRGITSTPPHLQTDRGLLTTLPPHHGPRQRELAYRLRAAHTG